MPDTAGNVRVTTVQVSLDMGTVVGTVTVNVENLDHLEDDDYLRVAATAWAAIASRGRFTVDGNTYSADECKEWWA